MQTSTPGISDKYEKELDLFDLWDSIWRQKVLVILVAVVTTTLGMTYASLATPMYQSLAKISEPFENQLAGANFEEYFELTPERAFELFLQSLNQQEVLLQSAKEAASLNDDSVSDAQRMDYFDKNLRVELPVEDKKRSLVSPPKIVTLSLRNTDPELSRVLLDNLIENAQQSARSLFIDSTLRSLTRKEEELAFVLATQVSTAKLDRQSEIERLQADDDLKKNELEESIELLRLEAKLERQAKIAQLEEDQRVELNKLNEQLRLAREFQKVRVNDEISKLQEALNIAQELGIRNPIDPADYGKSEPTGSRIRIAAGQPTEYWKGTIALTEEIKQLKLRQNQDPFNKEIRELERYILNAQNNEELESLRNRESDDPYITELPDLKKQLRGLDRNAAVEQLAAREDDAPFAPTIRETQFKLENLIDAKNKLQSDFSLVHIIQNATPSNGPVRPKKGLILALSLAMGIVMGVMVALLRSAKQNRERRRRS